MIQGKDRTKTTSGRSRTSAGEPRAAARGGARPGAARKGRPAPAASGAFPIVGVGASSGGLEAFRQLLAHVPADAGLAFVLVQHLDATRASLLSDALAPATSMRVAQAEQGDRVEPGRVYVIPPGTQMAIAGGVLELSPLDEDERRPHLPIDHFLRSLAADRGRQAIGVILSGTASDGTAGLAAIRAEGGVTFAQDPREARFPEMPRSAVDAGVVDHCLPLPELGAALARLASHPYLHRQDPVAATGADAAAVAEIQGLVRAASGVDFGEYKQDTFGRRLARRMAVRQAQDVAGYLALLRLEPAEVAALYEDLLIKVTSFFRDEPFFEALRTVALPDLLEHKAPGAPIRAWVVGCATGEEVYSLAIAILEHLGGGRPSHPILIFGSDASEQAIARARAGTYPDAAVRGLGEERLKRFFVRTERGWRVAQAVRDLCVFVRHDVARDPPFSRLDLVSCRNVLIYFGPALQRRVLAMAHYCLEQPGYLLLGRSESAAGVPRWFTPTGKGSRVFRRKPGKSTFRLALRSGALPAPAAATASGRIAARADVELARQVDDLVLARYGPAGVIVDDRLEVLQFRGRTDPYLGFPEGEPRLALPDMLRPGLAGPLRTALAKARRSGEPVRLERVALEGSAAGRRCDLVVLPLHAAAEGDRAFAVLFEERPPDGPAPRGPRGRAGAARRALEEELASAKESVAVLLEEHGRGSAALATSHDELVSGNEELQSLNEELETAKEELQASNEELTTLNDELNGRNQELQVVNADVLNLLDAVELPILMLDEERRLRRFTRQAAAFMKLGPADVGRRLADLLLPLQAPDLEAWIGRAMAEGVLVEAEVQDGDGRWHRLQVRPHRAATGQADGAILSLVDIQELKQEIIGATWARDYARGIVEAVPAPLVVLDAGLRVVSANAAYHRLLQEAAGSAEGRPFFALSGAAWDAGPLRQAVAGVLGGGGRLHGLELERDLPGAGRRVLSVAARALRTPTGEPLVLLAIEDVTARRELEQERAELLRLSEAARRRAEEASRAKDLFLANLSHELRTPLTSILLQADLLALGRGDAAAARHAGASILASARRQVRLVEDLLDVSRIVAGKLKLELGEVELRGLVRTVVEELRPLADGRSVALVPAIDGPDLPCQGDAARLQQVVANLVGNALKFTPAGGRVEVRVDAVDGVARLVVADTGQGIAPAFLPHVFDKFTQEKGAGNPGLGLGLAIAHELMVLHGGALRAESPGPGLGATFTATLPRSAAGPPPTA